MDIIQSFLRNSSSSDNWLKPKTSIWPIINISSRSLTPTSTSTCDDPYEHLPQYTLADVSEHWQTNDCWIVVEDLVYDVTEFLDEHPGGQYIVMEHAGRDATLVFRGSRHSQEAYDMLDKYLIGALVEHERMYWNRNKNCTENLYGSSPQPSKGLL